MRDAPKIHEFDSLKKLVDRLRDDFVSGHPLRPNLPQQALAESVNLAFSVNFTPNPRRSFPYRSYDFRRILRSHSRNLKFINGSLKEGGR